MGVYCYITVKCHCGLVGNTLPRNTETLGSIPGSQDQVSMGWQSKLGSPKRSGRITNRLNIFEKVIDFIPDLQARSKYSAQTHLNAIRPNHRDQEALQRDPFANMTNCNTVMISIKLYWSGSFPPSRPKT